MFLEALKLIVVPPLCLYLAIAAGCLLWKRRPRLAFGLIAASVGLLVLLSMPWIAGRLQASLEPTPTTPFDAATVAGDAQAIVVLGGDGSSFAPEFEGAEVGPLTLERVRLAARLGRETGLPILVTGGPPRRGESALARRMAKLLGDEHGLTARWIEPHAADTRDNAEFSARLLRADGIERVVVVTHAWHLKRALEAFERAGLHARGAGTGGQAPSAFEWRGLWPSARGLQRSSWALHEWIGVAWYRLR